MKKLIRPTYPKEFSIGLLLLIFIISFFLSHQVFDAPFHTLRESNKVYSGMFLISTAFIIMILIMWEEFLFPIKVKEKDGGMLFRNHRNKLIIQVLIYCIIPAIFIFIYIEYEISFVRYIIWAAVCMIPPVLEKLVSGINNYNDFLLLTNNTIEYKNNTKEGRFETNDIQGITVIRDERNIIKKIKLFFKDNTSVLIDLNEMELDAFYDSIEKVIVMYYQPLLIK